MKEDSRRYCYAQGDDGEEACNHKRGIHAVLRAAAGRECLTGSAVGRKVGLTCQSDGVDVKDIPAWSTNASVDH